MKTEKCWDQTSCIMRAHALGDTPILSRGYGRVHPLGRWSIIMFYIMLPWRLLILMGVRQKLSYQRRLTRQEKGSSSVQTVWWVHTRTYGLCVKYMVHIQTARYNSVVGKIDWYDSSHHCIRMFLHLTPIVGSLTRYFLKYSSHILPLFQVKARHSCTANDGITTRDHGTCID